MLWVLRSGVRHEATTHIGRIWRAHGRALDTPSKGVGMRRANQRRDYVGLREKLNAEGKKNIWNSYLKTSAFHRSEQKKKQVTARLDHLRVELAWEVLCHSHAGRAGLKLLLVEHTVHLAGLAAGRGGAGPARTTQRHII